MAELRTDRGALLRFSVFVAMLLASALAVWVTPLGDALTREGIQMWIGEIRDLPAAPIVFVALYALATAFALPGSVLTLLGGAVFGVTHGVLYTTLGANLGANAAFGLSRWLGRDGIRRIAGSRLTALDEATSTHGFRGLLTLRLIPAVPFNALNFGAGLTAISWRSYAVATLIGIVPGTVVYTVFADALLAGSTEASREAFLRVLVSGACLVLLSFLPMIARRLGLRLPGKAAAVVSLAMVHFAAAPAAGQLPTHEAFTGVLQEIVESSRVDYARLSEIRPALDDYLERLGRVSKADLDAATSNERLAFWINAYNACMLKRVVDHYPITVHTGFFTRLRNGLARRPANSVWQIEDVFSGAHCQVAGVDRSQDEIEHEIIRPMGDPRIHFVVNCAAISCPSLAAHAYTASQLDEELDEAVRHFMATPAHYTVDEQSMTLNKVLEWYRDDFGGPQGLLDFFRQYADPATSGEVDWDQLDVLYFDYDWTLNDIGR